ERPRCAYHCAPAARAGEGCSLRGATHRGVGRGAGRVGWRTAKCRPLHLSLRCERRGAAGGGRCTVTDSLALLWPPFVLSICLAGIHAYFGIEVLRRKVIFVDLAMAQIAALGATVAFLLGHPVQSAAAYGYSLGFTLAAAVLLTFTRAW